MEKTDKRSLQLQLSKLNQAVDKLNESLKFDAKDNDIYLDATIQRFEFTYEMIWKLAKLVIKHIFDKECYSPRSCFKALVALGILDDEEFLLNLIEYRNLSTHTYDYGIAIEVYEFIHKNIKKINELADKLAKIIKDENGK